VHYDLQTELVDHLANDIETIWETKPNLSFNDARDQSFKKFGVFGFMDVVSARQKAMSKRYMKILWTYAKEWFTFPKLLKTLVLFSICYLVFQLSFGKYLAISMFFLLFSWMIFKSHKYFKYMKIKEKPNQKLWLLEDLIFRNASANSLVFISVFINIFNSIHTFWDFKYSALIAACLFTFIFIYTYVSVIVLPKNAENLLKKTYPEFSL
jgi:hypothetical protein